MGPISSLQASAGISHPSTATAYFNTRADTDAGCGAEDATLWGGVFRGDTDTVGAWVEVNATTAKLTIAGPADVWFGLGLNASTMGGRPWAVVVDGHGDVDNPERQNSRAPRWSSTTCSSAKIFEPQKDLSV